MNEVQIQVWEDEEGKRHVTLWRGGMVVAEVEPNEQSEGKAPGFYDVDWNPVSEPEASGVEEVA